jgi:hypothetical protein
MEKLGDFHALWSEPGKKEGAGSDERKGRDVEAPHMKSLQDGRNTI